MNHLLLITYSILSILNFRTMLLSGVYQSIWIIWGHCFKIYVVLSVPILVNQHLQIRTYQEHICRLTIWVISHCSKWEYTMEDHGFLRGVYYRIWIVAEWFGEGSEKQGFKLHWVLPEGNYIGCRASSIIRHLSKSGQQGGRLVWRSICKW